MDIYIYNTSWIAFNSALAILPVIFAVLFFQIKYRLLRAFLAILWLLFLPNSIYVITDVIHLIRQWSIVDNFGKMVLVVQYSVLEIIGLTAFLMALYPLEKFLRELKLKKHLTALLVSANFIIGFGMVLGRVERLNSWDAFIFPERVFNSAVKVFLSFDNLALAVLFGLFANLFYFLFRRFVKKIL
jgi:uncharacterized membrane protein